MAIESSRAFLGQGWKFPVRVNPGGGLSWSREENDIEEAIWIILSTAPGERPMRPTFGCGIHELVFEPNSAATHGLVRHNVREALTRFEPRIDLEEVRVEAPEDQSSLMLIRIDYRVRSSNFHHNIVYPFYVTEGQGVAR